MRYRVLVTGLVYPTDIRIQRRLAAGEDLAGGERPMCEPHAVGDIIEDLPRSSVKGLIAAGWIEEVD